MRKSIKFFCPTCYRLTAASSSMGGKSMWYFRRHKNPETGIICPTNEAPMSGPDRPRGEYE